MSHVKDSSLARSRIKRSHRIPARLADFREFPQETSTTPKANPNKRAKQTSKTPELENSIDNSQTNSPSDEGQLNSTMPTFISNTSDDKKVSATSTTPSTTTNTSTTNTTTNNIKKDKETATRTYSIHNNLCGELVSLEEQNSIRDIIHSKLPLEAVRPKPMDTSPPPQPTTTPLTSTPSAPPKEVVTQPKVDRKHKRVNSSILNPIEVKLEQPNSPGAPEPPNKPINTALRNNNLNTVKNLSIVNSNTTKTNVSKSHSTNAPVRNSTKVQQQQQQQQQQTKYVSNQISGNMTPNMQYGTRLLINEPVYLPRNVATIAPITCNMQQMEDYIKKLPYLTDKAQQCIAYQEKMFMPFMISNYNALVRIASKLEISDLMRLRRVNKSWKSIIDSDFVWKSIFVEGSSITKWQEFGELLSRRGTKHLHLKNLKLHQSSFKFCDFFRGPDMKLESLFIETQDPMMNRYIMELLCVLRRNKNDSNDIKKLKVDWRVKAIVDDHGVIKIQIKTRKIRTMQRDYEEDMYCYQVYPQTMSDSSEIILLDLVDIQDLFNGTPDRDMSKPHPSKKNPLIQIEAT